MLNTNLFTIRNFLVVGLFVVIAQLMTKPVRKIIDN